MVKLNMKTLPLALIALFTLQTGLRAEPEIKGTPTEVSAFLGNIPGTVWLSGDGEIKVPADQAIVSLVVVTENKSMQEASRANRELRTKIIQNLTQHGLPAERAQAARFSSSPKYGIFGEKAKSYRLENVIKVKVADEKEFQTVVGLVDTFQEVRYEGVDFDHTDKVNLKRKALEQAMDKANESKRLYEDKLGVKLTPKSFIEGAVTPEQRPPQRAAYVRSSDSYATPSYASPTAGIPADTSEAPSAFGEQVFKASVKIEYALNPK